MHGSSSRRRFLAGSASLLPALGGCVTTSGSRVEYQLFASPARRSGEDGEGVVDESLVEAFRWNPKSRYADHQREVVNELLNEGSVTTTGYRLVGQSEVRGERFATPRFVESDGRFYRIRLEDVETVSVTRWVFWLDRLESEPPTEAVVLEMPESGEVPEKISTLDSYVLFRATRYARGDDVADSPLRNRGYVYHQVGPDESELVPDPSFDYVELIDSSESTYYTARTTKGAVAEQPQYTWRIENVAESAASFEEHLRESVLTAEFEVDSLSDAQKEILQKATNGPLGTHQEEEPLSDAYESILERIGLGGIDPPTDDWMDRHGHVYFTYEGTVCEARLLIVNPSNR